jgi:hypothetical protein
MCEVLVERRLQQYLGVAANVWQRPRWLLEHTEQQHIKFHTRHTSKQRLHALAQPKQLAGYTAREKKEFQV